MKILSFSAIFLLSLTTQFDSITNTRWVQKDKLPFDLKTKSILELEREGIKLLACKCQIEDQELTGQLINHKCYIRANGIAQTSTNFKVLMVEKSRF